MQIVFDERGKVIWITDDEIASIVNYIKSKGRVSVQQLARESNKLIRLEGKLYF